METDPVKIRELAKWKERENVKFRSFLKQIDMSPEEVDKVVRRIYLDVASTIDCTTCRNCCKKLVPTLGEEDIEKLARALGMTVDQFSEQYVIKDEEPGEYTFTEKPCPMLELDVCSDEKVRPESCKSYPYLLKDGFVFRTIGVIQNCFICPRVYHTYERLKGELWHYSPDDSFFEEEPF